MFTKLKVGDRFPIRIDGEIGMTLVGSPTIILSWKNITAKELKNVRQGKAQFALYTQDDIIFLCVKFGDLSWLDVAYTIHLESAPVVLEDVGDGQGYGLQIYLVDADTNKIKAMRLIGWETDFSRKFKEAVEKQRLAEFDPAIYYMKLKNIYAVMQTSAMVKAAQEKEKLE